MEGVNPPVLQRDGKSLVLIGLKLKGYQVGSQ